MKELVHLLFQTEWNILVSAKVATCFLSALHIRKAWVGLLDSSDFSQMFFVFCCFRHSARTFIIHLNFS